LIHLENDIIVLADTVFDAILNSQENINLSSVFLFEVKTCAGFSHEGLELFENTNRVFVERRSNHLVGFRGSLLDERCTVGLSTDGNHFTLFIAELNLNFDAAWFVNLILD